MANLPPFAGVPAAKSSTGVPAIAGADGVLRKLGLPRPYTAFVAADSITAFGELNVSATTVAITDNGDGTASINLNGHQLNVGQPVRINVAQVQKFNVMDSYVTSVIDANNFKFALGGRTHSVLAASGSVVPSVVMPWRRSSRGWFNWLEAALGVSLQTTWCAVGGATASQISSLIDATPFTEMADVGAVLIGMNNVYAAGESFLVAQANTKAAIDRVRARSLLTIVMSIPPRNSADSGNWTPARQAIHTKLNRWMHQYAHQIGGIFFDTAAATQNGATYIDPAATPYPDPLVSMMFDYTHPSARGAQAIGFGMAAVLSQYMGIKGWKPVHRSQISTDTGNLLVNGDGSGSTSGVFNTMTMAGITANASVVASVAARSDGVGNDQVITSNFGTATGTVYQWQWERYGVQGLLTAGNIIQWKVLASVANSIGLLALEIVIDGTLSDGTKWMVYGGGQGGNSKPVPGSYSHYLITPPATVPANITTVNIYVRGLFDNTQTTDAPIKLAQSEMLVIG